MLEHKFLGRLALGLILLISACSAPSQDLQAPTAPTPRVAVTATETATIEPEMPTPSPTEMEAAPPTQTVEAKPGTTGEAATNPGPSPQQQILLASLKSQGPAPELHNEVWLNSEPMKLADLRGKVVMVEFWTFG